MTAPAPIRVGWCPGALRPMASGDGLILRVKPRGGRITPPQGRRIAEVSRRFGNGALDLTSRANLQIRGIEEDGLHPALDALDEADLLDRDPGAEAVRNIVSSPLAGIDPAAVLDIRPVVAALERRLTEDRTLHELPPKFGFVVDDGGRPGLGAVSGDLRFEAVAEAGRPVFSVSLAGDPRTGGLCAPADVPDVAASLCGVFIAAHRADPDLRRLRHLVERAGAEAVLRRAGLRPCAVREVDGAKPDGSAEALADAGVLRVAAPFGRMSAEQLDAVAGAGKAAGTDQLRLTPWRAIFVASLPAEAMRSAATACAAAGLIVDASDPRLAVAACPGAPDCHRGSTPVLDHAARLAARLSAFALHSIALHVSGCRKGCAHAGPAPATLVGHDGRYDLVIDGRADDAPAAQDLSFEDAARRLDELFERQRP